MRETCARALAAALMTGAIATAVGLPSAFETASGPERGLTAPPSSLERTVRIPAGTVREKQPRRGERLDVPQHRSSRPAALTPTRKAPYVNARLVTRKPDIAPSRSPAPKPKPTPAPAPAPTPTPPAEEPPVAAPAPPPATDTTRELTSTPSVVAPEAPTPPVTGEPEPEHDSGKGKDKEKKDKDKEKDNGRGHGKED